MRLFGLKIVSILGSFIFSADVAAKDVAWDTRLEAALANEISSQKIDALKKLYDTETIAQNRIVAGYMIMTIAKDAQRYDLSVEYGEAILELTDEHASGNLNQRDAIVSHLIDTYFLSGQQSEGARVIDDNLRLNDAAIDDLWHSKKRSIAHRYSGFECPNQIDKMYREGTRNYHPTGTDIGCDYKIYNGVDHTISIYLTRNSTAAVTPMQAHGSAMKPVKINWANADVIIDAQPASFETDLETEFTASLLRVGNIQRGYKYTGAWTSIIEGWVLKTRITWEGSLGEDFGRNTSVMLFNAVPLEISQHLKFCKNEPISDEKAIRLEPSSPTALAALISLVPVSELAPVPAKPTEACLGKMSNEGNLFIEWYKTSDRIYSMNGAATDADVFVSSTSALEGLSSTSGPKYLMQSRRKNMEDGSEKIEALALYSGRPSSLQVIQDFADIYSGTLQTLGSVIVKEDGDSDIQINRGGKE